MKRDLISWSFEDDELVVRIPLTVLQIHQTVLDTVDSDTPAPRQRRRLRPKLQDTATTRPACVQCGDALPPRTGPGYPRRYCGSYCSGAAARERASRRKIEGEDMTDDQRPVAAPTYDAAAVAAALKLPKLPWET
jgi:hypothetical protein